VIVTIFVLRLKLPNFSRDQSVHLIEHNSVEVQKNPDYEM